MTNTELECDQIAADAIVGPAACGGICGGHSKVAVSRRTAIGAGAIAGAALITACGSGGSNSTTTSAAAAAGTSTVVAKVADIPAGGSLVVTLGKTPYALAKKEDGTVSVHSAVCTHQQCTIKAAGVKFHCDCHGSEFDAFTGAVTNPPAPSPLPEIAFEEKDGSVVLK